MRAVPDSGFQGPWLTRLVGTPALTPTTSGGLLARLSDSSHEQLQISRGFAGTLFETRGQGFLHLRTKALWSQDVGRKWHMLPAFSWRSWQSLFAPSLPLC